jgi:predicted PurR-regulated permease PerM
MAKAKQQTKPSVLKARKPLAVEVAMAAAVIGGLLFVSPYVGVLLIAAIFTLLFNPLYKWLVRRTKRQGLSIAATLFAMMLAVIIPIAVVTAIAVAQVNTIVSDIQESGVTLSSADLEEITATGIERINAILASLPGGQPPQIDKTEVANAVTELASKAVAGFGELLATMGGAIFGLISTSILFVFVVVGMLKYQDEILSLLKKISPFDAPVVDLYLLRTKEMTKAMVRGQFLIATAQGFAAAVSLWLVGIDYFWFFWVFLSFMSFIPLGAGIITIPIGIVLILSGQVAQGVFLILYHMFVVSSIDNFMRPYLVPKTARLNTALMLLAVFSGMALWGAVGVVYGPVLMILLVTTLYVYAEFNAKAKRIALPKGSVFASKPDRI